MAVKLRLRRMGRKKRPLYGVVAADTRSPRDGRFIEDLGRYEPLMELESISLNNERVLYWLENGAEPTDTVRSILSRKGLMLALHMKRKGAAEDEIWKAVEAHCAKWDEIQKGKVKVTARDRHAALLAAEEVLAREKAAEAAKKRAELEAKAQAKMEEARKQAAEDREAAAEEARLEQAEANVGQEKVDSPKEAAPEPVAEDVVESEPAAEAVEPVAEEESVVSEPEAVADVETDAEAVAEVEAAPVEAEAEATPSDEAVDADAPEGAASEDASKEDKA